MAIHEQLYVTDEQIREKLAIPRDSWPRVIAAFLSDPTFPARDPIVGRRYWPAVRAWLDYRHGIGSAHLSASDGEENWG
jgi:hypothetical protein